MSTPYPSMDMASLQALMQQFGPSEEDKRQARAMALMQAGAGLLGVRKGWEGQGIGQAIGGGLLGYNADLRNVSRQKLESMQGASAAMGVLQQQRALQDQDVIRNARAANFIPAQPGMPEMGPPTPQGQMQPAVPPTPESNNWQGFQTAVAGVSPQMAIQLDPFVRRQMMREAQAGVPQGAPQGPPQGPPQPPPQGHAPSTAAAFGMTQGQQSQPPQSTGTKGNATQQYIQQQLALVQSYRAKGLFDEANQLQTQLLALMPKSKPENITVRGADGKPTYMAVDDQGGTTPLNVAPADKLHFGSTGNAYQGFDPYTGAPVGSGTPMSLTPGERASNSLGYAHLAETQRHNQMVEGDPATVEQTAQAIAAGKLQPLTGFALARPMGQAVMARVTQINPDFDPTAFQTAQKAEKDFASGKQGNQVRSFNVAINHLDTLSNLSDALGNGNVKALNAVANVYKEQTGSPAPTNFGAAKQIVADEIVKAIVGSGGGVGDREKAQQVVAAANSPAQLKGVISTYKELMRGQLSGLQQQYEQSTKKNDFDRFLSGAAKSVYHAGQSNDIRQQADAILNGR